jgi:hypothetical protein
MERTFPKFGHNPVTGEWNDSLKGDYCPGLASTSGRPRQM